MTDLSLHGRPIQTFFDLAGESENALTAALGWVLRISPAFLAAMVENVFGPGMPVGNVSVELQAYDAGLGITDVELVSSAGWHAIIEAKKGWHVPSPDQLLRYARLERFRATPTRRLVILTERPPDAVSRDLDLPAIGADGQVQIVPLRWSGLQRLARETAPQRRSAERQLLHDFSDYLERAARMQRMPLDHVYIVSLGQQPIAEGTQVTGRTVVEDHDIYFHPYASPRWPREAPNFLGFRYNAQLQAIRHVDGFDVVENWCEHVPGLPPGMRADGPHILYSLGPVIRPPHQVLNGPRIHRSMRVSARIDLLLTRPTISEAWEWTWGRGRAAVADPAAAIDE